MSVEGRWPPSREKPFNTFRVHHEVSTSRECHVTTSVDVVIPRPKLPRMNQNDDEPNAGMQLLASVRYFLSSSLPQDRQDDLRQVLDSNGATPAATLKDATHIITNSHRFEGSGEVDAGVHVVTVRVACF